MAEDQKEKVTVVDVTGPEKVEMVVASEIRKSLWQSVRRICVGKGNDLGLAGIILNPSK